MKRFLIPAIVIATAATSSTAFAQSDSYGKTRAQVRDELIQARAEGELDAPDATYPTAQLRAAAKLQAANAAGTNASASAVGGAVAAHSQSGRHTVTAPEARDSIYFGQ
ncbi:DUF4148 domain-containing protein [Paraburkholderia hospita]|uniref:DUF4148 domain-containing protein n=1 Tax=Paraburkholderia hospita TaxID=169430 RepID=UPI000B341D7F|nr:DUF4148 domain-containing protein [Paraburkholderia hospita]OUL77798.1 hypothetical protein CA603_35405 [Paraburkholderia hospita]